MTRTGRRIFVAIGISALIVGAVAGILWMLSNQVEEVRAQEIVQDACNATGPDFDVLTTFKAVPDPAVWRGEGVPQDRHWEIKTEVSDKDFRMQAIYNEQAGGFEAIHADGVLLQREGAGEWIVSPLPPAFLLSTVLGLGSGENMLCPRVVGMARVGPETLGDSSTIHYAVAASTVNTAMTGKYELTKTDDTAPWTDKWDIWIDDQGFIVQTRHTIRSSATGDKGTQTLGTVTSRIAGIGEENVITKPVQ